MKYIIPICVMFLAGCGAGGSDYIFDLGGQYYMVFEGQGEDLIYYRKRKSKGIAWIDVYPHVKNYSKNKEYIIAMQELSPEAFRRHAPGTLNSVANAFYALYSDSVEATSQDSFIVQHFAADSDLYRKRIIPNMSVMKISGNYYLRDTTNYLDYIADSLLKNDPELNYYYTEGIVYWIIDKKRTQTSGPYDYQQLTDEMKRLGIDKKLKIPE